MYVMYNYTYMCGYSPQLVTTWGHGTHGRLQLCFQPIEVHPGCAAPILPALPAGISCTTPSNVASWLFKFPSLPWHLAQGAVQNEAPAILLSISPAPKNIRGHRKLQNKAVIQPSPVFGFLHELTELCIGDRCLIYAVRLSQASLRTSTSRFPLFKVRHASQ